MGERIPLGGRGSAGGAPAAWTALLPAALLLAAGAAGARADACRGLAGDVLGVPVRGLRVEVRGRSPPGPGGSPADWADGVLPTSPADGPVAAALYLDRIPPAGARGDRPLAAGGAVLESGSVHPAGGGPPVGTVRLSWSPREGRVSVVASMDRCCRGTGLPAEAVAAVARRAAGALGGPGDEFSALYVSNDPAAPFPAADGFVMGRGPSADPSSDASAGPPWAWFGRFAPGSRRPDVD